MNKKAILKIVSALFAVVGFVMVFLTQYNMVLVGNDIPLTIGSNTVLQASTWAVLAYAFAIITFVALFAMLIFAILEMFNIKGLAKVFKYLSIVAIIVAVLSILTFVFALVFVLTKNANAGTKVISLAAPCFIMFASTFISSALIFVEQKLVK